VVAVPARDQAERRVVVVGIVLSGDPDVAFVSNLVVVAVERFGGQAQVAGAGRGKIGHAFPRGIRGCVPRRGFFIGSVISILLGLNQPDADFGGGATARVPTRATFLALKEYRPRPRLLSGEGLFASGSIPLPLDDHHFSSRTLQVTRVGQAGFQHFFTHAGRPFCLYAVISADRPDAGGAVIARDQLDNLNGILATLTIGSGR